MNNARRKQLDKIISKIEVTKNDLESVLADEEEYRDNMPENLQSSERYERAESAVSELESAIDCIDDVISSIEAAQE